MGFHLVLMGNVHVQGFDGFFFFPILTEQIRTIGSLHKSLNFAHQLFHQ